MVVYRISSIIGAQTPNLVLVSFLTKEDLMSFAGDRAILEDEKRIFFIENGVMYYFQKS